MAQGSTTKRKRERAVNKEVSFMLAESDTDIPASKRPRINAANGDDLPQTSQSAADLYNPGRLVCTLSSFAIPLLTSGKRVTEGATPSTTSMKKCPLTRQDTVASPETSTTSVSMAHGRSLQSRKL